MFNSMKRNTARLMFGGREHDLTRLALASRSARIFTEQKRRVKDRYALYELLSHEFIQGRPFDYLEFGVFEGSSIKKVAAANPNPKARLFGFDSFEGLPHEWNADNPRGTFDKGGRTPAIADPRVKFVKGWFDDTLPVFLANYVPQERLWIHIDADLYSSAIFVLAHLNKHIKPGALVMFDEIEDLMNEFKALCDFEDMAQKKLRLIAATPDCRQAAFICAPPTHS